jgi:hypothetical protein
MRGRAIERIHESGERRRRSARNGQGAARIHFSGQASTHVAREAAERIHGLRGDEPDGEAKSNPRPGGRMPGVTCVVGRHRPTICKLAALTAAAII